MKIIVDEMICCSPDLCQKGHRPFCSKKFKENKTGKHCLECPDLKWENKSTIEL